jgi:ERF superfamily
MIESKNIKRGLLPEAEVKPKKFLEKLIEIYEEVDHIEKRGENEKQHYRYVKAADVAHPIRKALMTRRIYAQTSFTHLRSYEIPLKAGGTHQAIDLGCTVTFIDAESDERIHVTVYGSGCDGGDKAVYKAMTGALKYALRTAFLLPDESDPENEEHEDPPPVANAAKSNVIELPRRDEEVTRARIPDNFLAADKILGDPSLPDQNKLDEYYKRLNKLTDVLSVAGLKADRGVPAKKKFARYIQRISGESDFAKIPTAKWEAIFTEIEQLTSSPDYLHIIIDRIENKLKEAA